MYKKVLKRIPLLLGFNKQWVYIEPKSRFFPLIYTCTLLKIKVPNGSLSEFVVLNHGPFTLNKRYFVKKGSLDYKNGTLALRKNGVPL